MSFRRMASLVTVAALALGGAASNAWAATDAQGFVQEEQQKLSALLHQPASPARAAQIERELDAMVDYDALTQRAFGEPCPLSAPGCADHWKNDLSDANRAEVRDLLRKLVVKNYQKNLEKTLDYDVTFRGAKDAGGDTKVRTEAKSKAKPRDPAVQVDYIVQNVNGRYRVVDIVTEGSSLTKNYYDQFDKKLKDPSLGYANIVQKLREKIAAP
jgi:phospholipid transport system substrate-binding protein